MMTTERIKENVKKVLARRGYTDIEEEDPDNDYIAFIITFQKGKEPGKCFYCMQKMGIEQMSEILAPHMDEKLHLILLYSTITNYVLKAYKDNISKFLKNAELIDSSRFYQDIMSHPIMNSYKLLSDEEAETVLKQYTTKGSNIEETKELFPKMLTSDPVCILMGYREGQIVQVYDYYNFSRKVRDTRMPPAITYCIVATPAD